MQRAVTPAKLAELLNDPVYNEPLGRMATLLPAMWATYSEIAWRIGGNDNLKRKRVYRLLAAIRNCGVWESLDVMHNTQVLQIMHVDPEALRAVLAEVEA
jgi:hypothetical protein